MSMSARKLLVELTLILSLVVAGTRCCVATDGRLPSHGSRLPLLRPAATNAADAAAIRPITKQPPGGASPAAFPVTSDAADADDDALTTAPEASADGR